MVKTCKIRCNNGELSVKPFRLQLVVKKTSGAPDDEGAWQSDDAEVDIIWNKGGGRPWNWASDTVARGVAGKNFGAPTNKNAGIYRYTVVVKVPGQPSITIDPEVDVSEGGPPGPRKAGKKKSAKKK